MMMLTSQSKQEIKVVFEYYATVNIHNSMRATPTDNQSARQHPTVPT
eukprot:COSAG01_NODE_10_length_42970_cov_93.010007_20_plen_47_part_00